MRTSLSPASASRCRSTSGSASWNSSGGRGGQVAAEEEAERLPEGTACCPLRFAATRPRVMRGQPSVYAIVVSPDHVCGNRKSLEILDAHLPLAMGRRQFGERVTPLQPLKRAAGALLSIGHGHRRHDTWSPIPFAHASYFSSAISLATDIILSPDG